ncbi:MAG TPA: hypothetical protein VFR85_06975 [Anaeromyxobacteraceae bacterium]|nr:hypothetical protein [Anaeromyxobacteraceae bacterium]
MPVLTAAAGDAVLGEPATARLVLAAMAILAGIGLTLRGRRERARRGERRTHISSP